MSATYPLRAKTYGVVARGQCPACLRHPQDLRFCYNPHGDDQLLCEPCAERSDRIQAEDAATGGGGTAAGVAGEVAKAIDEAYAGWPPHVRERFDREIRNRPPEPPPETN